MNTKTEHDKQETSGDAAPADPNAPKEYSVVDHMAKDQVVATYTVKVEADQYCGRLTAEWGKEGRYEVKEKSAKAAPPSKDAPATPPEPPKEYDIVDKETGLVVAHAPSKIEAQQYLARLIEVQGRGPYEVKESGTTGNGQAKEGTQGQGAQGAQGPQAAQSTDKGAKGHETAATQPKR